MLTPKKPIEVSKAPARNHTEPWTGPSNISTFARCLRLLELDQRDDWPGITEQTFSTKSAHQNLQQRIKCVEWSLYRLFEIWDPYETRDKLRPFFPPLAPLQSLNLRAALLRALAELKKNGVLGREAVLRKTMLDECKGEKFEEIICAFAMAVLRKIAREKSDPSLRLACSDRLPDREKDYLLPLVLAYRDSLHRQLVQKDQIAEKVKTYLEFLGRKEAALTERRASIEGTLADRRAQDQQVLAVVEELTRRSWMGDDRWTDIILNGIPPPREQLLESTFEDSLNVIHHGQNFGKGVRKTILEDLNERTTEQDLRFRKWKAFRSSLQKFEKHGKAPAQSGPQGRMLFCLNFDQHQSLNINPTTTESSARFRCLTSEHEALLHSMNRELASLRTLSSAHNAARLSGSTFESEELSEGSFIKLHRLNLPKGNLDRNGVDQKGPSKEILEVLSSKGARLPLSQASLVPSMTELSETSWLEEPAEVNLPRRSGTRRAQKLISTQIELLSDQADDNTLNRDPEKTRHVSDREEISNDDEKVGGNHIDKYLIPNVSAQASLSTLSRGGRARRSVTPGQLDSKKVVEEPVSPLASQFIDHSMSSIRPSVESQEPISQLLEAEHPTTISGSKPQVLHGTLLERTRQSMALLHNQNLIPGASVAHHPAKSASHNRRRPSQRFSIERSEILGNSTENPDATTEKVGLHLPEVDTQSSTSRDHLFDEEADYASVFKSRPRIGLGPTFSPERNEPGSDSMLT